MKSQKIVAIPPHKPMRKTGTEILKLELSGESSVAVGGPDGDIPTPTEEKKKNRMRL